jgi:hypothetical protein
MPARPKIDRIACPWLIARFIDDAPAFLYVSADFFFMTPFSQMMEPPQNPGRFIIHAAFIINAPLYF